MARNVQERFKWAPGAEPVGDVLMIGAEIDGGGAVITTGAKGFIGPFPFKMQILEWTLAAAQSGSIVLDLWKDTYANFPPVDADSICASALPTISAATKGQSTTLTGWTTTLNAGEIMRVNVDSVTTIEYVLLGLRCRRIE